MDSRNSIYPGSRKLGVKHELASPPIFYKKNSREISGEKVNEHWHCNKKLRPTTMTDAELSKSFRELFGYTQRDLAKVLEVSHGAVGHWERGARPICKPIKKLMRLLAENEGKSL